MYVPFGVTRNTEVTDEFNYDQTDSIMSCSNPSHFISKEAPQWSDCLPPNIP